MQVRYGDLDPRGHVNNVSYFAFLEAGRSGFFHHLDRRLIGGFVVAHTACDFLIEIPRTVQTVSVDAWIASLGTTSVTIAQQIRCGSTLNATAQTVLVHVDASGRPRPFADEQRRALGRSALFGAQP